MPRQLHPSLYNNSLNDVPMTPMSTPNRSINISSCQGVPGFPDFPDVWQGETSEKRQTINDGMDKKHSKKWKINNARTKRQERRVRKAVNLFGTGKEIKKRLRDERRIRRKDKVVQLQQRRERKKGMGDICRGLAVVHLQKRREKKRAMGDICRGLASIKCK